MILIVFAIIGAVVYVFCRAFMSAAPERTGMPDQRVLASVAAKRMEFSGGEHASTRYYVTFERPNGERTEFMVNGRQYGQLAEGDSGVLTVSRGMFAGFERRTDRYSHNTASANAALRTANANMWHKCTACGATYRGPVCDYCGTPACVSEE